MPVATADPAWGGARAWRYLRWHPRYRTEWRSLAVEAARERAPFPVRVQSEADLAAARWGLFAWQDPFADVGPLSPFWTVAPSAYAVVVPPGSTPADEPLGEELAREGARLSGLRLGDGTLLLKVEHSALAGAGQRLSPACGQDRLRLKEMES